MQISLIVARARNGVIGRGNQMPWHLPVDLKWFRQNTLGKAVIMGRKTFESIGRVLPDRPNIILSRSNFQHDGAFSATDLSEALKIAKTFSNAEEVMVIGGGELFKQTLPFANKLYLTEIQADIDGDTFFEFEKAHWQMIEEQWSEVDSKNPYLCHFMVLKRVDY